MINGHNARLLDQGFTQPKFFDQSLTDTVKSVQQSHGAHEIIQKFTYETRPMGNKGQSTPYNFEVTSWKVDYHTQNIDATVNFHAGGMDFPFDFRGMHKIAHLWDGHLYDPTVPGHKGLILEGALDDETDQLVFKAYDKKNKKIGWIAKITIEFVIPNNDCSAEFFGEYEIGKGHTQRRESMRMAPAFKPYRDPVFSRYGYDWPSLRTFKMTGGFDENSQVSKIYHAGETVLTHYYRGFTLNRKNKQQEGEVYDEKDPIGTFWVKGCQ